MAEEQSKYLEFNEGKNKAWVTGFKYEPSDGTPKGRGKIMLTFAAKPTSEAFDAPFTTQRINLPKNDDSQFAKIQMDKQIKSIIFPLLQLEPGTKVKFSELVASLHEAINEKYDILCELDIELNEGKNVNKETGNPVIFANITALKILEGAEKTAFESSVDWDGDDWI